MRLSRRLEHLLGVAVIGRDQGDALDVAHGGDHIAEPTIDLLHRPHHGGNAAGVPDHVGVGEVDDDEAVVAAANALDRRRRHARGAHLRTLVIRDDVARRRDQHPRLTGMLALAAAVEEVGDVGILLRLRDVQLGDTGLLKRVGEHVPGTILGEGDGAGLSVPVRGHRGQPGDPMRTTIEVVEGGVGQRLAELAGAVRTEVEEDDLVARGDPTAAIADHDGLHELVGDTGRMCCLDRGGDIRSLRAHALHEQAPGALHPLPALIAIQRVDAAADVDDAGGAVRPLGRELRQQRPRLLRRDIASVSQRVHGDVRNALRRGQPHETAQVVDVAVHAAVGDEPDEVQRSRADASALAGGHQRWYLLKVDIGRLADAYEVLRDDAARTDRQMPDLGVPHLPLGQTDGTPGRDQAAVGIVVPERVEHRRVRHVHGVAGAGRSEAPAVEDDQDDRLGHEAAAAIASRLSASSDAPPTSAPSMSGCASSSAAFSGLTEPP